MMMVPRRCAGALWASQAGFLFIRAPAQPATPPDQRFFTPEKSGWEGREIQFKVKGNTFLDFCILKVQQVFNWGSLWLMVWQHAQLAKSCMPAAREGGFFQTHAAFTCSGWIYRVITTFQDASWVKQTKNFTPRDPQMTALPHLWETKDQRTLPFFPLVK